MKNISYELIEKFREKGSGKDVETEILRESGDPSFLYALSPNRENLFEWYPFEKTMDVLMLGAGYGAAAAAVCDRVASLDIRDGAAENLEVLRFRCPEKLRENGGTIGLLRNVVAKKYDVVIVAELSEEVIAETAPKQALSEGAASAFSAFCERAAAYLKEGGSLLLAVDNPSALRFMTGAEQTEGRVYPDRRVLGMLCGALPFAAVRHYYPLPDNRETKDIFSEIYLPEKGDFRGVSDAFERPRYQLCDEESMYGLLCENGAYPPFAPGELLVFSGYETEKAALPEQIYVRYNRTRLPEYQTKTEIFERGGERRVVKTALSEAGNDHILSFEWKYKLLCADKESKLRLSEPKLGKNDRGLCTAEFPYLEGESLSKLLAAEIRDGRAPAVRLKEALELVLGIGAHACHNMDCLFENVMKCGETYYYLDYEWVFENPLDRGYLCYRVLRYWYEAYKEDLYAYAGLSDFLSEFGIKEAELPEFEQMEASFQQFVHGDGQQSFIGQYKQKTADLADVREMERKLSEFTEWNLRLQDEVEEHKETISKNLEVQRLSQNHILNIEKANRIHEADIAALQNELSYLRKHESLLSRAWRRFCASLSRSFPEGSRKGKLLRYAAGTFRHPVRYFGMYLSGDGRRRIRGDFKVGGEYAEGGFLRVPFCEAPKVSIIIPVYNQVAYTYACVRSILAHTSMEETPYEIILADDVSTDATAEIQSYIEGLIVSRNEENQGFLKNCNQAAKKARGAYLLFLNNDTKVTANWLLPLIQLIESDSSAGMVGSKLIYPDGRLQEAGGIIWSDASGWNYGRLDDPSLPQYNYVREVDYISGAAIMIEKALWDEIGGFDERFAPAYCEDSDLAFEVRKHGKKVLYQPKSVVVHFEGISNGTDVNGSGLKQYQLVNQKTFREKWKKELKNQSKNTGNPNPFDARERGQEKKCVLFIDHYVPTWDKDAGSKTTYQYIRMFLKKGYRVKFLGDNFQHEEPYAGTLEQLGVEILSGEKLQSGIWDWFKENESFIDAVYLNRPHIAIKYIDFLKKNTSLKCIYYGHDLHFLRLMREYELTGDIRIKRESDYWKSIEFQVMHMADMNYYPSQVEVDAIHEIDPTVPVKAITAYVWDSFEDVCGKDYAERNGLLFVGGFAHPPNADGVLWFAKQVFPKIRAALPEIRFYIAGSKPTEEVLSLGAAPEKSGIEVLGFVSDGRLKELYGETKLTVVPLRYGAGVKGKVVEALYYGSVIVTTSVGAEGIPQAEEVMAVINEREEELSGDAEEAAEAFAEAVIKLYREDDVCAGIGKNAQRYIRSRYSMDAAWEIISGDF